MSMRVLVSILGLVLAAYVTFGVYWFVETQRELTDISSVELNGEKTVLIETERLP